MSDAESAGAIRAQMWRARALQEHINLLGAGLPDPCAELLAAARAVVEAWDALTHVLDYRSLGQIADDHTSALDALRAAVEDADGGMQDG